MVAGATHERPLRGEHAFLSTECFFVERGGTEIPMRAAGTTDTERLSRIVRGFKLCCHRGCVLRVTARDIAKTVLFIY